MKARMIDETTTVNVGDTLFDKHPNFTHAQCVQVTRVTKAYIFVGEAKYRRDGSMACDEYRRKRLYIEAE